MITPHIDEINERNPEGDPDYRELSANSTGRLDPIWQIGL